MAKCVHLLRYAYVPGFVAFWPFRALSLVRILVASNNSDEGRREGKKSHIVFTLCSYRKGSIFQFYFILFFLAKPELLKADTRKAVTPF